MRELHSAQEEDHHERGHHGGPQWEGGGRAGPRQGQLQHGHVGGQSQFSVQGVLKNGLCRFKATFTF